MLTVFIQMQRIDQSQVTKEQVNFNRQLSQIIDKKDAGLNGQVQDEYYGSSCRLIESQSNKITNPHHIRKYKVKQLSKRSIHTTKIQILKGQLQQMISLSPLKNTMKRDQLYKKQIHKISASSSIRTTYSSKGQYQQYPQQFSPDSSCFQSLISSPKNNSKMMSYVYQNKTSSNYHKQKRKLSGFVLSSIKTEELIFPVISAASYIVMNSDNHQIIAQKNKDNQRQIASLTKMMTAFTVINLCNANGIRIKEHKVPITEIASYMEGTTANLRPYQELSIYDLLHAMLLPSGNDAATALAHYFGGYLLQKTPKNIENYRKGQKKSQKTTPSMLFEHMKAFISEMNINSEKMCLYNTSFANPTGLSNAKNYSTAKDMAILTSFCLKNHLIKDIFKKKYHSCQIHNPKTFSLREHSWKNTNIHLFQFKQCIGAKTGITPTAGPCLSSIYKIQSRQIIVILLNSNSVEQRYEDAKKLYKWARAKLYKN